MTITFEETNLQGPCGASVKNIILDGKKIGHMNCSTSANGDYFHAVLNVIGDNRVAFTNKAIGFGETPEQALKDAFEANRHLAIEYLTSLNNLKHEMGIKL